MASEAFDNGRVLDRLLEELQKPASVRPLLGQRFQCCPGHLARHPGVAAPSLVEAWLLPAVVNGRGDFRATAQRQELHQETAAITFGLRAVEFPQNVVAWRDTRQTGCRHRAYLRFRSRDVRTNPIKRFQWHSP